MQTLINTNAFETFVVGDAVNWSEGTDTVAGTVVRVTKTRVVVRKVETTLLNGVGSGEPDALTFHPGGFAGHTSGTQRYAFGDMTGEELVFSRRQVHIRGWDAAAQRTGSVPTTCAKLQGTSTKGSMSSWGRLRHGHAAFYDFNR